MIQWQSHNDMIKTYIGEIELLVLIVRNHL